MSSHCCSNWLLSVPQMAPNAQRKAAKHPGAWKGCWAEKDIVFGPSLWGLYDLPVSLWVPFWVLHSQLKNVRVQSIRNSELSAGVHASAKLCYILEYSAGKPYLNPMTARRVSSRTLEGCGVQWRWTGGCIKRLKTDKRSKLQSTPTSINLSLACNVRKNLKSNNWQISIVHCPPPIPLWWCQKLSRDTSPFSSLQVATWPTAWPSWRMPPTSWQTLAAWWWASSRCGSPPGLPPKPWTLAGTDQVRSRAPFAEIGSGWMHGWLDRHPKGWKLIGWIWQTLLKINGICKILRIPSSPMTGWKSLFFHPCVPSGEGEDDLCASASTHRDPGGLYLSHFHLDRDGSTGLLSHWADCPQRLWDRGQGDAGYIRLRRYRQHNVSGVSPPAVIILLIISLMVPSCATDFFSPEI